MRRMPTCTCRGSSWRSVRARRREGFERPSHHRVRPDASPTDEFRSPITTAPESSSRKPLCIRLPSRDVRAPIGVYGESSSYIGVFGRENGSSTGYGVAGESTTGKAVYGLSTSGYAGWFQGNVNVTGTLTKGGGAFRIDHPLHPAHTYLQHSFVESPDMLDVYNGNVRTNRKGFATVRLPGYFQALNRSFRYQLTIVGRSFARAIVWKRIEHNRFTIRTDRPNVQVSWQVTGIRHDRYANAHRIRVVLPKSKAEQGKYLHPELYGQRKSEGIGYRKPANLPSRRSSTR